MANSVQSSDSDIDDIRDSIALNEGILASLEGDLDSDGEASRQNVRSTLKLLRRQLRESEAMDPRGLTRRPEVVRSNHLDGTTDDISDRAQMDATFNRDSSQDETSYADSETRDSNTEPNHESMELESNRPYTFESRDYLRPPSFHKLVSRKRQRTDSEDYPETREVKSLRTTPSPNISRPPSPSTSVNSLDSFESDELVLGSLLAGWSKEEKRENERALRELERKKRQEQEDAELAKLLEAEFNQEATSFNSTGPASLPVSSSQSVFRADGTFNRREATKTPQLPMNRDDELELLRYPPGVDTNPFTSAPRTGSDDDISEIPANMFRSRQRSVKPASGARLDLGKDYRPSSGNVMPGAFPGSSIYKGMAGTRVYDSSTSSSSSRSKIFPSWTDPLGLFMSATAFGQSALEYFGDSDHSSRYGYIDPAATQEEIKDLLKHVRPDQDLTPQQLADMPKGLKVNLLPHQVKGLAWMKKMEEASNKGGILADDMGLGKTLQAIALILERPPPEDQRRPTLVIAPVALLQQWQREIQKMVRPSHSLSVLILHGSSRKTHSSWKDIKMYDVVLTSYGLLTFELKRRLIYEESIRHDPNAANTAFADFPILGKKAKFHRVILDEAQCIKNRATKGAIAANWIQAEYRWCLSGTPMQNNVEEIYSLIKFCQIKPYNNYNNFSRDFSKPLKSRDMEGKDKAMQQLQVLLKAILLRRTKKSEIDGKPILQLPPKNTIENRAVFSSDELAAYKDLESRAQTQFSRYVDEHGRIGQNYSRALVWLLRLRQCCCHPDLAKQAMEMVKPGNLQDTDMLANSRSLKADVVERLKQMDGFECPVCLDAEENPVIFPCGHNLCSECLTKICDQALNNDDGTACCPHCRAKINANKITDYMSFLRVHCPEREGVKPIETDEEDLSSGTDSDDDDEDDSDDGRDLRDFIVDDEDDFGDENDGTDDQAASDSKVAAEKKIAIKGKQRASSIKRKNKDKKKSKDSKSIAQLRKEASRNKAAKRKYLKRLGKDWKSSAKIEKTLKLLQQISDRGENEKTIIFSSFTSFLDLVEVPLSRNPEFKVYARYDGSMTANDRNSAVLEFTDNPACKVILVSIRAGNAGLNLTAANHVIILDPFWNPFVEYQAADRCHRIGQLRDVTVHRILIGREEDSPPGDEEFTVEDRILQLQEKKRELVETALDESAAQNVSRLGVRELGYLFGVNSL